MALNNGTGSCRYKLANITTLRGVEELSTSKGVNIVDIAENFSNQLDKFNNVLSDFSQRITKLEKAVKEGSGSGPKESAVDCAVIKDLTDRLKKFEDLLESDDLRGRTGPQGPKGERGPKCKTLGDIEDVSLDGIEEGAILVRRGTGFKFEVPESE
jgi:hypothetical protein